MAPWRHRLSLFLLIPALAVTGSAQAAPVPQARNATIDKYLPDDTTFVVVVDLKQGLESQAFKKHYQQQVTDLLKMEIVQAYLKDTGFDPLKDLSRLIIAMGQSSFPSEGRHVGQWPATPGPMLILEGNFDAAKLEAKVKSLPKDLQLNTLVERKMYEIAASSRESVILGLPDKNTLIFSINNKDRVLEALDKAVGKKKTKIQSKAMEEKLGKLDLKQIVTFGGVGEMVLGCGMSFMGGGGAQQIVEVKHQTLADQGLEGFHGAISLGDNFKGHAALKAKDGDAATKVATMMEQGLKKMIEEVAREAQRVPELTPVVEVIKTVKTSTEGNTIKMEGSASLDSPLALIRSIFQARAVHTQPVPGRN